MNINKQSFEEAIDILVNASPKNNTKGNAVKHWFSSNFKLEAGVSLTYDDKAIGNRVTEQFRHKFDVVIFVISTNVNIDTLKRYIKKNLYPELQVVLILTNTDPYTYNALLFNKESAFSSWAKETFRLDSEKFTFTKDKEAPSQEEKDFVKSNTNKFSSYYTAFRTKPFMLLAGISGTGKSRIVREFAFKSCPKELQDKDGTEPGNYCMIEVKPNWHDSTELLGYWSNLNKRYMFTKFAKFLVKAKMYPNVPFFVCLDEMNLAPVEQYFAEFLSVLETRKAIKDEEGNTIIKSGVLIDKEYFRSIGKVGKDEKEQGFATCKNDRDIYMKLFNIVDEEKMNAIPENKETSLLDTGLTLPENVLVIGTVNMDDTTHQFSRKVIDRAMTIEMNGGALTDIFRDKDDLAYRENPLSMDDLRAKYVSAKEVIKNCTAITKNEDILKYIKGETENGLPQRLEEINKALYGTPFMVSYRVMNELTIYLAVLLDKAEKDGQEISLEVCKQLANTAIDKILLMKILPRVEGDDEMFRISEKERTANGFSDQADDGHEFTKLDWLRQIAPQHTEDNKDSYMAVDKLSEMIERLNRQSFTRFWP